MVISVDLTLFCCFKGNNTIKKHLRIDISFLDDVFAAEIV